MSWRDTAIVCEPDTGNIEEGSWTLGTCNRSEHGGDSCDRQRRRLHSRYKKRHVLMGIRCKKKTQNFTCPEKNLSVEEAPVHRNKVARLNHWAVDYPHLQRAVSVFFFFFFKFSAPLTEDDWLRLKRIGMHVKGFPTVGVTYTCQKPLSRLAVPRDSDWAGDRKRRTSVLSGSIRSVIHPWRSWSEDFCTFWVT